MSDYRPDELKEMADIVENIRELILSRRENITYTRDQAALIAIVFQGVLEEVEAANEN